MRYYESLVWKIDQVTLIQINCAYTYGALFRNIFSGRDAHTYLVSTFLLQELRGSTDVLSEFDNLPWKYRETRKALPLFFIGLR